MPIGKSSAENLPETTHTKINFSEIDIDPTIISSEVEQRNFQTNSISNSDIVDIFKNIHTVMDRVLRYEPFRPRTVSQPINIHWARHNLNTVSEKLKSQFGSISKNFSVPSIIMDFLPQAIDEMGLNVKDYFLASERSEPPSVGIRFDFKMFLNVWPELRCTDDDIRFMILHELRHIQQLERGWLEMTVASMIDTTKLTNTTKWKKREVGSSPFNVGSFYRYCRLPQELDASCFAISHPSVDRHNCQMYRAAVQAAMENMHIWNEKTGID